MSKPREIFLLPDHTTTKSAKVYVAAWRQFARPICDLAGLELGGLNPDVWLRNKHTSVSLPVWFVRTMNMALVGNEEGKP